MKLENLERAAEICTLIQNLEWQLKMLNKTDLTVSIGSGGTCSNDRFIKIYAQSEEDTYKKGAVVYIEYLKTELTRQINRLKKEAKTL